MYKNNAILMSKVNKKIKKNPEIINPVVSKTRNGGTMILWKCVIFGTKKSIFTKKEEAKRVLSNLCIRAVILGDVLP